MKSKERLALVAAISIGLLGTCSAQTRLSLSSNSAMAGGSTSLNLSLTSMGGLPPAALQFAFNYQNSEIGGFTVSEGPAAISAGKTIKCSAKGCVLFGLNNNAIQNGIVAVLTLHLADDAFGHLTVQLSNTSGSSQQADPISILTMDGVIFVTPQSLSLDALAKHQHVSRPNLLIDSYCLKPRSLDVSGRYRVDPWAETTS
jgi:hypothetical protein